jgi:hypothetical protein
MLKQVQHDIFTFPTITTPAQRERGRVRGLSNVYHSFELVILSPYVVKDSFRKPHNADNQNRGVEDNSP